MKIENFDSDSFGKNNFEKINLNIYKYCKTSPNKKQLKKKKKTKINI